jgi:hypothetical protein
MEITVGPSFFAESNQIRVVEEGGLPILFDLGRCSVDPQTQKMVAGAIANLCGNSKPDPVPFLSTQSR